MRHLPCCCVHVCSSWGTVSGQIRTSTPPVVHRPCLHAGNSSDFSRPHLGDLLLSRRPRSATAPPTSTTRRPIEVVGKRTRPRSLRIQRAGLPRPAAGRLRGRDERGENDPEPRRVHLAEGGLVLPAVE